MSIHGCHCKKDQNNMKKILFITNNWLTDSGGRRVASTKIINNLAQNGFDTTVVDFETGIKPISRNKAKKNVNFNNNVQFLIYFIKSNNELVSYFKNISSTDGFDIVILIGSPYFDIIAILTIKLLGLFKRSKTILYSHIHPLKSIQFTSVPIKNFIFHLGYYILSYFIYGFFDRIVTPGFALKNFFVSDFRIKPEKISVINNPIFDQNNKNYQKSLLTFSHNRNKKIIITSARLSFFQKDFPTLFKALKEVNKKIDCKLMILGEGVDREKIVRLAKRLKIFNLIKLLGFKKDPISYIKKAYVFVLSTTFEGCPIVLVEAMIAGVPVVSSNCDFGPQEILENGKSGVLVPVGDYKSMAKAIIKLLENNKLSKQFIKNGLNRAKYYSDEKSFGLWNRLLSEK